MKRRLPRVEATGDQKEQRFGPQSRPTNPAGLRVPPAPNVHPGAEQVRQLLKARNARADFFGPQFFAEPAWDILLVAYLALLENEQLSIKTACSSSSVSDGTVQRWLAALEHDGWILRCIDPESGERSCLQLTASGRLGMERYMTLVWPSAQL